MSIPSQALDRHFAEHGDAHARYRFSFGRDATDSYELALEALQAGQPGSALTAADLMNLLPTGSSFRRLVGWRSMLGAPVRVGFTHWVAVGVEHLVPHVSRGAYPVSRVYLYDTLESATGSLKALLAELPPPAEDAKDRYAVYYSESTTPDSHRQDEASTITWALDGWTRGQKRLFRTLLIDESTLRLPRHPGPPGLGVSPRGLRFDHDQWLLCATPVVRQEAGMITKLWMEAKKWR